MLVSVNFELPTVLKLLDLSVKIYTDTSVKYYWHLTSVDQC